MSAERGAAFLTFFDHKPAQGTGSGTAFAGHDEDDCVAEGRHAGSVGTDVAAEIVAQSTRPQRDFGADRRRGPRPESRSGQTGRHAVCGWLRDLSSQRTRSCQGPLQSYALPVPATALREQFELGLGADLLSGVRRKCTARPVASRRGEAVASCDSHITLPDPSARRGAGAVECFRSADLSRNVIHISDYFPSVFNLADSADDLDSRGYCYGIF